jgi:tyrosyl-tRNA synthetase
VNAWDELSWRGLIQNATDGLRDRLADHKVTVYNGFDATGSSLHVGHLVPIMGLVHMQRCGHPPIVLVGGGTSLIGDPGGRTDERSLLSHEEVEQNTIRIRSQLSRFLDFDAAANPARLVNNAEWLHSVGLVDFLRQVGKGFSLRAMLGKDTVIQRMARGISFTEFSYMLVQAYDFLMLYQRYGCTVQAGGRDQWGNITVGTEFVRRTVNERVYGIVFPLLTTESGMKFGKSVRELAAQTIWLDAARTAPAAFYRFWLRTQPDRVIQYLKFFTLLEQKQIAELEALLRADPGSQEPQRVLAREITCLVHGEFAYS